MTLPSKQNADVINRLRGIAPDTAISAIEMAEQIGLLLLAVRDDLGHGKFGAWADANLSASMRQARRYMAAAQGKRISRRTAPFRLVQAVNSQQLVAGRVRPMELLAGSDVPTASRTAARRLEPLAGRGRYGPV